MRKHRPYGTYKFNENHIFDWNNMDVQEVQDTLAQGNRIRNKKAKRRIHNKVTRRAADASIREQLKENSK